MSVPPRGMRLYHTAYRYSWVPSGSCEACSWLSLGLFDTAEEARTTADEHARKTGDRVKLGTAYDY